MALSLVAPTLTASASSPRDCPLAPPSGAVAFAAGMNGAGCEHTDAGPCVGSLGCVGVVAIRPASLSLITPSQTTVLGVPAVAHLGDLFLTGPPTPPPNQI